MRIGGVFLAACVAGGLMTGASAAEPGALQIAQAGRATNVTVPEAATFISSLADKAIKGLTDKAIDASERAARFRVLLTDGFDIPQIARFVLGRYWRVASDDERGEYLKLFEDFIVRSYANRFGDYAGENLQVGAARAYDDQEVTVFSDLLRPSGPPVKVEWKLRRDGSSFRIIDVVVEGVSMSITQRDDFSATIQRNGGKVQGLIANLREKMTATAAETKN